MRSIVNLLALILIPVILFAQQDAPDTNVINNFKNIENTNSQLRYIAHHILEVNGPRLTNSPGYVKTSMWIKNYLADIGLKHAALEPWGEFGNGWSLEHNEVALKSPYYKPLIALPKAWTPGTGKAVTGKIVLLDQLDSVSITKQFSNIKGNIVMVKTKDTVLVSAFTIKKPRYEESELPGLPDANMVPKEFNSFLTKRIIKQYHLNQFLKNAGALAIVSFNSTNRDGTLGTSGSESFRKDFPPLIPEIVLTKEDYLQIQRTVMQGSNAEMSINIETKWYKENTKGNNVIAEIPGTDPRLKSEIVIAGAHLDSWHAGTGATDNGAGCIVMMEAMRILKASGIAPKRTIRIALWGGEEQGLMGSFGYVKKHFGDPETMQLTSEQKNVSVYFNLDNGSGKIRGIYLQNNEDAKPIFTSWLAPFKNMGATGVTSSNTGATDHLSFDAVGIPAFQFIQDPLDYMSRTHHTNMDTYDHLEFDDLKQASIVMASFIYNAAMRDDMIPRKPLPKAEHFIFDIDLKK